MLARARLQLSQAVGGALSDGLEALGERLEASLARGSARLDGGGLSSLARPGARFDLGPLSAAAQAHAHRLREVVERDRAQLAASSHEAPREAEPDTVPPIPPGLERAPFVASAAAVAPVSPVSCDEPIRTRTMAKLLALQGHRQRALSIYDYLLAHDASDQALCAEAERLRSAE